MMSGREGTSNLQATASAQNNLNFNTDNTSLANMDAQGTDQHSEEELKKIQSIIEENQSMIDNISHYQNKRDMNKRQSLASQASKASAKKDANLGNKIKNKNAPP